MPLISFVMPNRNKEQFLPDSVNTILNQTLEDIELVIVDDDSTDDSRIILEAFAKRDGRIKLKFLEGCDLPTDERIDRNRNIGNQLASADFICVTDSDDWYSPKRAEITYGVLKSGEYGLFYSSFFMRDEFGNQDPLMPEVYPARPFSKETLKRTGLFFIGHPTVGYKKDIILKYPYNTDGGVGDWGMFYSLLVLHDIPSIFTTIPLMAYRATRGALKELIHTEHCDPVQNKRLFEKKKKKMKELGGLEDV